MLTKLKTSLARKYYKYVSATRHKIVSISNTEFCVRPDNYIDRRLWVEGGYEKEQLLLMSNLLSTHSFDAFLDIGTNFGLYSCILGKTTNIPTIHSFECDPRNLFQLYGHIAMNGLMEKVNVHPYAAGDKKEEKTFSLSPATNSGTSKMANLDAIANDNHITVSQVTIDSHLKLKGKALLCKIDVEGYEHHVIKGMTKTLKDKKCYIQIELLDGEKSKIIDQLKSLNYSLITSINNDFYFTNMDVSQ